MATTQPLDNPAAPVDADGADLLAWVCEQAAQCARALKDIAPHLATDAWTLSGHVNQVRAERARG